MNVQAEKPRTEDDVVVHATFAAATKQFNEKFTSATPLATVLAAVLAFFNIESDGTTRYFFVANGDEQDPSTTVGAIAEDGPGHSHSVKLSLRTETISGS
ncbi:hypothetical protein DJ010_12715 [Nocardioides silvaticus]|uniref:Uncharacterized protein n=1 Tax=Nocardioides silvaticus TaxID=2201891 RepID=A0A316TGF9_9ACTN|nr:hypothetical protein [Nocardioides silvaticus]PWN02571.1 hypothetical protein DJ010_12715 [Nocardioides silvaticus]